MSPLARAAWQRNFPPLRQYYLRMPTDSDAPPFAEFSFKVTEDRLRRLYAAFIENSEAWKLAFAQFRKKLASNFAITVGLGAAFFLFLILVVIGVVPEKHAPVLLMGSLAGAGTGAMHGQRLRTQFKALKSGDMWVKQSVDSGAVGPWYVGVADSGVRSIMNNANTFYRWEYFSSVESWPTHVAILSARGTSLYIPIDCFASHEAKAFTQKVRAILESHACTDTHRIVAYLRDQSTPCPNCRYELKGAQHATCPECGLDLTFDNIPGARGVVIPPRN